MVPDQGTMTQLMIMLNILRGDSKPASISRDIGITLQGVQYNIKQLEKRGLLDSNGNVTKEGFSFVESYLTNLRNFVSSNLARLDSVLTWEAIAEGKLNRGEKVGLRMKDGYLYASRNETEPAGTVAWDSENGGIVGVGDVKGMIGVDLGDVIICVLSTPSSSADAVQAQSKISSLLSEKRILAVSGEQAFYLAKSLGLSPRIEFSSLEGSFEAASRGLKVLLIISGRRFHFSLDLLKEMQTRYPEINLQIKYL